MSCLPNKHQRSHSQTPSSAQAPSAASGAPKSHSGGVTYDNLPYRTDKQLYHKVFILAAIQYITYELNPWGLPSVQLIPILQAIWDTALPSLSMEITTQYMVICL